VKAHGGANAEQRCNVLEALLRPVPARPARTNPELILNEVRLAKDLRKIGIFTIGVPSGGPSRSRRPVPRVVTIATHACESSTLVTTLDEDAAPGGGNETIERTDRSKPFAQREQFVELIKKCSTLQQVTTRRAALCVERQEKFWRGRLTALNKDLSNHPLQRVATYAFKAAAHRARTTRRRRWNAHRNPPPRPVTLVNGALEPRDESARHAHRRQRPRECRQRCRDLNDRPAAVLDERIYRNDRPCDRRGDATRVTRIHAKRRVSVTLLATSECCGECAVKAEAIIHSNVQMDQRNVRLLARAKSRSGCSRGG
jgi:hypothetical protein